MRLIDADKLVYELEGLTWYHTNKKGGLVKGANSSEMTPLYKAEDIYMYIDNAPTVTPDKIQAIMSDYLVCRCEPQRPQGEWNYIQAGMCVCPFCGATPHKEYKNFCAKCGADLRGEEE